MKKIKIPTNIFLILKTLIAMLTSALAFVLACLTFWAPSRTKWGKNINLAIDYLNKFGSFIKKISKI